MPSSTSFGAKAQDTQRGLQVRDEGHGTHLWGYMDYIPANMLRNLSISAARNVAQSSKRILQEISLTTENNSLPSSRTVQVFKSIYKQTRNLFTSQGSARAGWRSAEFITLENWLRTILLGPLVTGEQQSLQLGSGSRARDREIISGWTDTYSRTATAERDHSPGPRATRAWLTGRAKGFLLTVRWANARKMTTGNVKLRAKGSRPPRKPTPPASPQPGLDQPQHYQHSALYLHATKYFTLIGKYVSTPPSRADRKIDMEHMTVRDCHRKYSQGLLPPSLRQQPLS